MKMSDALRGAAETAPIDDVHVETATAARRVRRHRAVRVGANGIVGVGAAALVVAGVMGAVANQAGVPLADDIGAREGDAAVDGAAEPGLAPADDIMLACGYAFDAGSYPTGDVAAVVTLGDIVDGDLQLNTAYSTSGDASYTVDVPGVYVIWDGIVVGNPGVMSDAPTRTVSAAEPVSIDGSADLVNCWDGGALPAGDYTIVTVTPLSPAVDEARPVEEPTGEPTIEPQPIEPSDGAVDPDASVSSDDGAVTDIAEAPPTYAVSDAVTLAIAGDAVEDPFGQYLNPEPPAAPEQPSDALTSDAAREAYEAALAGAWGMEPGTQRVVKTGDSQAASEDLWASTYFGCKMEGTNGRFPAESADLDWLTVDASIPGSIDVSYGWVVNGNPVVGYGVTNATDWSLPGFYSGATPHLVLVSEGRVVAEAWPVNPDNNSGGAIAYATDDEQAAAEDAKLIWAPVDDYLAPGEQLSGDYLWRDVNGCWTGDSQTDVTPGTYTLLSVHDMYLGGAYGVMEGDPAAARDAEIGGGEEPALIAPDSGADDYVSFQVWTSLGQVTVTN